MFKVIGIIIAALLLTECGGHYDVGGTVKVDGTVKHEISIDGLTPYFTDVCKSKQPGDLCYNTNIDTCVSCSIGDFLTKVGI
jgi:hypothetical protein